MADMHKYIVAIIAIMVIMTAAEAATARKSSTTYHSFSHVTAARKPTPFRTGSPRQAAAKPAQRESLLWHNPTPPSPALTQIIRERESRVGPGWLGTAFLISLLSRHDLSNGDRGWIQSKIDSLKGADEDGDQVLLPPTNPLVRFKFDGIDSPLVIGEARHIQISATDRNGNRKPAHCELARASDNPLTFVDELDLSPTHSGLAILTCRVDTSKERRLITYTGNGV
jgi:hypothetical protein